jgi:hypothetical protein
MMSGMMLNTQIGSLELHLNLIYDNAYHEKVLLPGKKFTAAVTADNKASATNYVSVFIAFYTEGNRLVDTVYESKNIPAYTIETLYPTITRTFRQRNIKG